MVHIRKRLPKRGGNQFYKARPTSDQNVLTFCGSDPTDKDVSWAQRNTKWTRENACPSCLSAVDN